MSNKTVRLTKSKLREVITESVKKVLKENEMNKDLERFHWNFMQPIGMVEYYLDDIRETSPHGFDDLVRRALKDLEIEIEKFGAYINKLQ